MKIRLLVLLTVCVGLIAGMIQLTANDANGEAAESLQMLGANTPAEQTGGFSPYVDQDGSISLPKDYRKKWSHLGSWAVAKKLGETVHEMHDVYTQPETITAFNRTGEFPDGAVLVKEVRKSDANRLTTGHAAWSTDLKIWFMMIKDSKERFPDNEHWGEGWGWALFESKNPIKNVSAGYDSSCIACHTPVADSDWVYTYGYPNLQQLEK